MYRDEYDPADWWKNPNEYELDDIDPATIVQLTETEKKIAHYEKRAREHWRSWKIGDMKTHLYHYKQCNIKVRILKAKAKGEIK